MSRAVRSSAALLAAALLAASAIAGCGAEPGPDTGRDGTVRLPPERGAFDYQLGGPDDVPGLAVVVRDATASPLPGAYNVCYVNGFQTQPGSGGGWLAERPSAVLHDRAGRPVVDPDWPDEYVLDPSTAAQRTLILDAMTPVVTACADAGYDAVEYDNLDTFTRFTGADGGRIDSAGAMDLARAYVTLAHRLGLAAGQKNAAEVAGDGRDAGFDFAVAEECAAFDECGAYADHYGPHVLRIEYADALPRPFADVCADAGRAPLVILRDRGLVPRGTAGHVYRQCP